MRTYIKHWSAIRKEGNNYIEYRVDGTWIAIRYDNRDAVFDGLVGSDVDDIKAAARLIHKAGSLVPGNVSVDEELLDNLLSLVERLP